MNCKHCGDPLTKGTVVFACGCNGDSYQIKLPDTCDSRACKDARDDAAIEKAIAAGIIDR